MRNHFLKHFALMFLCFAFMSSPGHSHETRPAIADVEIQPTKLIFTVTMPLEPLIAGMDLSEIQNTDESLLSQRHDQLRALSAVELESAFNSIWPEIQNSFRFKTGATFHPAEVLSLTVPQTGDVSLARDSVLALRVQLPTDEGAVSIGWSKNLGPLVLRQVGGGEDAYTGYLNNGELSAPLPRSSVKTETEFQVAKRFIVIGFAHIIPKGLDHILFVLGLYFFSQALRPLLLQITSFTLAHTITLGAASLGIISLPAGVVEPLIAISIVYVAIENIFGGKISNRRLIIVFLFGLLHGLGFASVLSEFGLEPSRFLIGLLSFNVGVELGQITVVLVAFLTVGYSFGKTDWFRNLITIPASTIIGITGAWWAVERTFL